VNYCLKMNPRRPARNDSRTELKKVDKNNITPTFQAVKRNLKNGFETRKEKNSCSAERRGASRRRSKKFSSGELPVGAERDAVAGENCRLPGGR
jgi:hypothetical protein